MATSHTIARRDSFKARVRCDSNHESYKALAEQLQAVFEGAVLGSIVMAASRDILMEHAAATGQFSPDQTLFGHSTCPDELNHFILHFSEYWGESFALGGLAGIPFTGRTGFSAFSHHVPDDGSLFIVYAAHCGISSSGQIGHIKREGMAKETSACGSAIGAFQKLMANTKGCADHCTAYDPLDMQQGEVEKLVKSQLPAITGADSPLVALAGVVYDRIRKDMMTIVRQSGVTCPVALLGGIQINTPHSSPDFFQPRHFELLTSGCSKTVDLSLPLKGAMARKIHGEAFLNILSPRNHKTASTEVVRPAVTATRRR